VLADPGSAAAARGRARLARPRPQPAADAHPADAAVARAGRTAARRARTVERTARGDRARLLLPEVVPVHRPGRAHAAKQRAFAGAAAVRRIHAPLGSRPRSPGALVCLPGAAAGDGEGARQRRNPRRPRGLEPSGDGALRAHGTAGAALNPLVYTFRAIF